MKLPLWHKVCAKISEWFKNSKSPNSEPDPENPEKKIKCVSGRELEIYKWCFLIFYWLIGFISFGIMLFCLSKLNRSSLKVETTTPKVETTTTAPQVIPLSAPCSWISFKFPSLYGENLSFDLYALLRENETDVEQENEILWTKRGLTHGDLQSMHRFSTNVSIPGVSGTY